MSSKTGNDLFIVDNSDDDWKVLSYLAEWSEISSRFDIATGYFEIGSFLALDGKWQKLDQIRILMGGHTIPSSNNYNPKLIRHHQNCVISAGAISNHGHPHKNVVQSILAKPERLQLVTENDPMGFIEYLKFKNN